MYVDVGKRDGGVVKERDSFLVVCRHCCSSTTMSGSPMGTPVTPTSKPFPGSTAGVDDTTFDAEHAEKAEVEEMEKQTRKVLINPKDYIVRNRQPPRACPLGSLHR